MDYHFYEIESAFERFCDEANAVMQNHRMEQEGLLNEPEYLPYITVAPGRRFWKMIQNHGRNGASTRVFGFVEKTTGNIYMAATYNAPALKGKNAVRGNVMEDDCVDALTPFGIIYDPFSR